MVVVVYFLFLISMCVLHVVVTTIVYHVHHRADTKPFVAMPICVSTDNHHTIVQVYSKRIYTVTCLLLLALLMGRYCFARWRLSSVCVVCRRL